MNSECVVKFSAIDQVQSFIDDVRKIPYDVDAYHGNYIVDAKSILGILSLSLGREITLRVRSEDKLADELLNTIAEKYK